jgi:hypothetical protein
MAEFYTFLKRPPIHFQFTYSRGKRFKKNCSYVSRNGITYVTEAIASVLKWKWSECETRKIFSTQFTVSPTVSTKKITLTAPTVCHISHYWRHTDKMAVRSRPTTTCSSVSLLEAACIPTESSLATSYTESPRCSFTQISCTGYILSQSASRGRGS